MIQSIPLKQTAQHCYSGQDRMKCVSAHRNLFIILFQIMLSIFKNMLLIQQPPFIYSPNQNYLESHSFYEWVWVSHHYSSCFSRNRQTTSKTYLHSADQENHWWKATQKVGSPVLQHHTIQVNMSFRKIWRDVLIQRTAGRDKMLQNKIAGFSPLSFGTVSALQGRGAGNRACWTCHWDLLSDMILSGETARRKCWLQFYFTNPKTAEIIYFCCKATTHTIFPSYKFWLPQKPCLSQHSETQQWHPAAALQHIRAPTVHQGRWEALKSNFLFNYMYKLFPLKKTLLSLLPFMKSIFLLQFSIYFMFYFLFLV